MTSLLAFAWRKANHSNKATSAKDNNENNDSSSPSVCPSSSEETLTKQASEDSMFDSILPVCKSPQTPEALQRRTSPKEIRRRFGLPPPKPSISSSSPCLPPICSALPPVFQCGSMPSPQISTSSFYSRSSHHSTQLVAESPDLKVGKAKTAVGALVALADARESSASSQCPEDYNIEVALGHTSILPPRSWLDDNRTIEEANDFSIEIPPYESLNDSQYFSQVHASDDESSIHGSPSSNRRRDPVLAQKQLQNTSFTRGFLRGDGNESREEYDFKPITSNDLYVSEIDSRNLNFSGMSSKDIESLHSLVDDAENEMEYYDAFEMENDRQNAQRSRDHQLRLRTERRLKDDLLVSTLERLQDEINLVLEVMNGLRELHGQKDATLAPGNENIFTGFKCENRALITQSLELILDELRASSQDRLLYDNQNLDCKYEKAHYELRHALSFCHCLVRMAIPSSEKTSQDKLSLFGIPQPEHRWKCAPGFRAALGFAEEPRSPDPVRGGDTSLFSLPSESANDTTPHTSNLSMTSTITSAFSPERNRQIGLSFNRVDVRRTLESVSILFDKLGATLAALPQGVSSSGKAKTKKAVEDLKRIYLELLTIPNDGLKALIDSFELEFFPLKIQRLVSEDQDENVSISSSHVEETFQSYNLVPSDGPRGALQQTSQTEGLPLRSFKVNVVEDEGEEGVILFTPSTEDMRSIQPSSSSGDDDLRRAFGSFEVDDTEERDGPPLTVSQETEKKGKFSRTIWKRRRPRMTRTAE